jgi:DNA-binding CsgD family transcriptional regulator
VAPWTFVGRADELRRLTEATNGATGRGLMIGGLPGIGKSRLLRAATDALDPARHALITVTGSAATAELPLASLAPALPAEQPSPAGLSAGLLRWAIDAVQRVGAGRPVVLAIDDAHLLDPLSAAVVHHAARVRLATVLGTLRTGAAVPDPVRALWIDDLVDRIDLGPLTRAETADLLHEALGGPVEPASVDRLWHLATGNALFLRELVRAARPANLVEAYGVWRWTGRFDLTSTLADVVDNRIGHLAPEVRDVLELVAFGEPLGLSMLVKATDGAAAELAEERGLIRVSRDDRRTTVRLAHPLYGEVVRRRCPLTRVRRLQADLAQLIEATGARRHDDLLRVAVWRMDSDTARDPRQLLRASRQAFVRHDTPLAIRLGRAALGAGGGYEVAEGLVTMLFLTGRHDEALSVLAGAAAPAGENDRYRARSLCLRAVLGYWGRADETAPETLAAAVDGFAGPLERGWLRAVESLMRLHHGEPGQARRLAAAVLDGPAGKRGPGAIARTTIAHLLAAGGSPTRAVATLSTVDTEPPRWRTETPYLRLVADLARGTAMILAADLTGVADLVAAGDGGDRPGPPDRGPGGPGAGDFPVRSGYHSVLAAQAARLRGDLAAAGRLAAQACATMSSRHIFAGLAHAERAHVAALTGDAELARTALAEADAAHAPTMAVLYPWFEHARAWAAVAGGDHAEGLAILGRLAGRTRADDFHGHELLAHLDLVRLGGAADVTRRVRWLAAYSDNPLADTIAWYAEAQARRDGAALLTSVMEFQDLGMNLYAAEAAAAAVGLLREVRSSAAAGAAEELAKLVARCPDARTPPLRVKQPSLTRRERQIAGFAAAGVASKEIAERLFLSSRTVDNHLMRVYAKLGVSGRTELASALRTLPRPADDTRA